MIVSCPACETRFQVDREQLGYDGRIVRCGKCGNCWHEMPERDPRLAAMAAASDITADTPPLSRRRSAPPLKKRNSGLAIGWLLLLLFVAAVVAGGWLERERIVARFPQLGDVYALIGVPVLAGGPTLQLSEVTTASAEVEGDTVITVRGVVSNVSDRKQTLPPLHAQITNASGAVLVEWIFDPPHGELDAGGSTTFETETRNPPEGAQNVSITFAGSEAPAAQ
jgi:predicted Zn finger-like uncharacterized protein